MITPEDLNPIYEAFWRKEAEHLVRRMADCGLREAAEIAMREELTRLPVRYRRSTEALLHEAECNRNRWRSDMGRHGRRARKPDALQLLIIDVAKRNPSITDQELLEYLTAHSRVPPLEDIDEDSISFQGASDGALKSAPRSGLKHRLSRAKKLLKSKSR